MLKQLKPQRSFGDSSLRCGLIKDLKTRYWRRLYRLTIKKLSCDLQIKNASFL